MHRVSGLLWDSKHMIFAIFEKSPLGYPAEFADLLAKQLGSPKAIDRLAAYIDQARPGSVEMIIDEMLAIRAEIDTWKEKKESQEAQAEYSRWLNSAGRLRNTDE